MGRVRFTILLSICAAMVACEFSVPYQLARPEWHGAETNYPCSYERSTINANLKIRFANIDWGAYCLYSEIRNSGTDTLAVSISEFKAFDHFGEASDLAVNGKKSDSKITQPVLIPVGKSVSLLFRAHSLHDSKDRQWADSISIVFPSIKTTNGKPITIQDTLVFTRQAK